MRMLMNTHYFHNVAVKLDNINQIIGPNGSGKSYFCRSIAEGFEGKLNKQFIMNGQEVTKHDYAVYHIKDTDTIEIEKSFSAKSLLKEKLIFNFETLEPHVVATLNNDIQSLEQAIQTSILNSMDGYMAEIKLKLQLQELVLKNINLEFQQESVDLLPLSKKRLLYIDMLIKHIKQLNQPTILIIDDIHFALSEYEQQRLIDDLKQWSEQKDVIIFISSSYIYKNINKLYVYKHALKNDIISNDELLKYIASNKHATIEEVKEYYHDDEIVKFIEDINLMALIENYFLSDMKLEISNNYKKLLNF